MLFRSETDCEAFDAWDAWVPMPGCFVKQWLEETGEWDEIIRIDTPDPQFPVQVDVEIEGSADDAYVTALVPWKATQ